MFKAMVVAPHMPDGTVEAAVSGAFPVKHAAEADVCIIDVGGGPLKADALTAARSTLNAFRRKTVYLCGDVDAAALPQDLLSSPCVQIERGHTVTECLWFHVYRLNGGLKHA